MIYTGTESLLMLSIFMPLADAVCAGLEICALLRDINTLSVDDNIVMMRIREINERGLGC